jgi:hypothetical protein
MGGFIMTKGQPLKKVETQVESTSSHGQTHTTPSSKIHKRLADGETFTIKNKSFSNLSGFVVKITGTRGHNQTLIIEDCKFEHTATSIYVNGIDNVIVKGNYFNWVGTLLHIRRAKNINVSYNKMKDFGVMPDADGGLSGGFYVINSHLDSLLVEHNLFDRSGDNRPNTNANTLVGDYLSMNSTTMSAGKTGMVRNNYLRGSDGHNESCIGAGILAEHKSSNIIYKDNVLYNTGQYLIGAATSYHITFDGNIGYSTWEHDRDIKANEFLNRNPLTHGTTVGVNLNTFAQGKGDEEIHDIKLINNRILSEHSNAEGTGRLRYYNFFKKRYISEITNNNFSFNHTTGGWESDGYETAGSLSQPTREEVLALIEGADGAGMFATHGTGSEYFRE